jgi:deoxyhypusine synthase
MINLKKVKRYSIKERASKVSKGDFALKPVKARSFSAFLNSLPNILKAKDLRAIISDIISARKKNKGVILMAGAHVIKCGLNPVLIDLLEKKIITCICLNGAGIIHDFEIAYQGKTSEDVAANLKDGKFGMGKETADFLNSAVKTGVKAGFGLGYAVANKMAAAALAHKNLSLIYNAYKHKVPVCVFVGIGTDIIHQHPSFDPASTAVGSLRDFHILVENIRSLNQGGVVLNFGSAVLLPEVFLKALNLARNLGNKVKDFTAANFDMLYQYRAVQNVVSRPVLSGGKGYYIIGHHEIMIPLLAQSLIENI